MKRLSSLATPWVKWGIPAAWLLIVATAGGLQFTLQHPNPRTLLVVCLLPLCFGIAFRFQIWPLADAVDDLGQALRVRRRGLEVRIPLTDIVSVSVANFSGPIQVRLRLSRAGEMGAEISFLPRVLWNPFAGGRMMADLMRRAAAARAGSAR